MALPSFADLQVHATDNCTDHDHQDDDRPALPSSRGPADAYDFWLKPFPRMIHEGFRYWRDWQPCLSLTRPKRYMLETEDASMPADT
jgi:hypothetical protein